MALNSFTTLPKAFASAKVMGQGGALLGNVKSLQRDSSGKPAQLKRGVVGGKVITLVSNEGSYEERGNIVVTDMEATKAAMAAAVMPPP